MAHSFSARRNPGLTNRAFFHPDTMQQEQVVTWGENIETKAVAYG